MAACHLTLKIVQRSKGRLAAAAAACVVQCKREGKAHDHRREQGVVKAFIVAPPEDGPARAYNCAAPWNAARAREVRRNGVTAREWELGLPAEVAARPPFARPSSGTGALIR